MGSIAASTPIRDEWIQGDGIRLHVLRAGSGPPVILLHGFPEDARTWKHQIPALVSAGFSILAPDLRGYGRSDRPTAAGAYHMKHLVADVARLVEATGQERAHVVGHDWGGVLAWAFAGSHPDLVDKRTYLNVVIRRLLLDWKNHHYGKWRPSVWARRLGRTAIELERLIGRDGHGVDEAIAILSSRPGYPDAETLHDLAAKIPRRTRRTVAMSAEDLESLVAIEFEDPVEASQRTAATRRLVRSLRSACRKLSPFDQRLIHLRFERNLPVRSIAALLGVEARPLYRRIDKVAASLRRALVAVP